MALKISGARDTTGFMDQPPMAIAEENSSEYVIISHFDLLTNSPISTQC